MYIGLDAYLWSPCVGFMSRINELMHISLAGAHVITVIVLIDTILCCRYSAGGSAGW